MDSLAKKLMSLNGQTESSNLPSAIFGTAGTLSRNLDNRERYRIGLWPIVSEAQPAVAMGLGTVLAFLLERWDSARIYRIFAKLDADPETYTWRIEDSQFDVDDWQLDQLDENVAVWGRLEQSADGLTLTLDIENDLTDEEETITVTRTTPDLVALVNTLPDVSQEIMTALDADTVLLEGYKATDASKERIEALLKALFDWQIKLLLDLWGKPQGEQTLVTTLDQLLDLGKSAGRSFGPWCVANAAAHAMQPGFGDVAEIVADRAPTLLDTFDDTSTPSIFISRALFELKQTQAAYTMLENALKTQTDDVYLWLTLAELYRQGGRLLDSATTFQRAIEADAANVTLYTRYVELLTTIYTRDMRMESFVLIDPHDYDNAAQLMAWEAIESFEEALKLKPANPRLIQLQCLQLIAVREQDRLWQRVGELIDLDETGERVRTIADAVYPLPDIDPLVELLERAVKTHPDRVDMHVNLAIVYTTNEQEDKAIDTLEAAEKLTEDTDVLADIDRLYLIAEDPEFEARLGEIGAMVDAGATISSSDSEFLEDVLEQAPGMAEVYVLLAKTYRSWGEAEDALEVLMDGHERVPEDPTIIFELAKLLWESGQKELTFDYLNKGLGQSPNYVPLLAITGRYLFENEQVEDARPYLARAEALSPRHPVLVRVRRFIADELSRQS